MEKDKKKGGKKVLIFLGAVIVALCVLSFARDAIIRSAVSLTASAITGTRVEIKGFSLSVISQTARISGFRMYNPAGFSRGILLDLPKVYVQFDVFSFLQGKLHLYRLDINLQEIGLEKNSAGKLNVDSLKIAEAQKQEGQPSAKARKPEKPLPIALDLVNLTMGRVVFKDYSAGKEPVIHVYDINLKKSYKHITSAQQLTALIITEPLKHAGIKGAAIYGVAALGGVAILPVAVAATFVGKDYVRGDLEVAFDRLYDLGLEVLRRSGKVIREEKAAGVIHAEVNGAQVVLKLVATSAKITRITISARRYMLPKPEIANGILYQITEKLN